MSRTTDNPTTTIPNGSSAAFREVDTSMATAVCPVTMTSVMPYRSS